MSRPVLPLKSDIKEAIIDFCLLIERRRQVKLTSTLSTGLIFTKEHIWKKMTMRIRRYLHIECVGFEQN